MRTQADTRVVALSRRQLNIGDSSEPPSIEFARFSRNECDSCHKRSLQSRNSRNGHPRLNRQLTLSNVSQTIHFIDIADPRWNAVGRTRTTCARPNLMAAQHVPREPHLQNAVQEKASELLTMNWPMANRFWPSCDWLRISDERSIHLALNDADAASSCAWSRVRGRFMCGLALLRLGQSREADAEFGKAIDRAAEEKVPELLLLSCTPTGAVSRSSREDAQEKMNSERSMQPPPWN